MRRRVVGTGAVLLAAVLTLSACGSTKNDSASSTKKSSSGTSSSKPIKAAWIYVGSKTDGGWSQAHDEGRQAVEKALGDKVQTTYKENVPEGPATSQVIEQLVADGNKIIFATSFGFQDAMVDSAKKHPDVYFEQATGSKTDTNLGEYYGAGEDTDYLTGMAAGAASKSGKIGFVAPFPIPEVIREINSYTLGAQTTHPGATVQVVWTNTWFNPGTEKKAAESLIAAGVDALGQGQDSPATGDAAKEKGLPWSGYDRDQNSYAPDNWLTATTYNWGDYYIARTKAAADGTWKSDNYYGGLKDGFVRLAPFGKIVTADTRAKIKEKQDARIAGTFYQFTGPLKDQSGAVKVPAGTQLQLNDILTIDWFVQGVIGSPKGS
jgi:basic membrane lipoprotein Med (substrate-binding protein (PBP1-ABC) superfamily)